MKNSLLFLTVVVSSLIVISCNKSEDIVIVEPSSIIGFDNFSLSIENNTLIFESKDDLDACFDYLDRLGDENFDVFEKAIGYSSYRSYYKFDSIKSSLFEDDLYKTLLNPERKIVVGDFLLQDCPLENKIYATRIMDECQLSSDQEPIIVDRNEDVFSILNGEVPLKSTSTCPGKEDQFEFFFQGYVVNCKLIYYKGIVKYLKAQMTRNWGIWGGYPMLITTSPNETCWWRGSSTNSCDFSAMDEENDNWVDIRINVDKLYGYNFSCQFCIINNGGQPVLDCVGGSIGCAESTGCQIQ